jgi:hypothetical protein
MPEYTEEEILARWQQLAGDDSPEPWTEDDLGMFFQNFRPHGEGVEAAFERVIGGEVILPRLKEVYQVTAEGAFREDTYDGYFIVRQPAPLKEGKARELCAEYLGKVAEIAKELSSGKPDSPYSELAVQIANLRPIEVVEGERPWPPDDEAPEGVIYELRSDFIFRLKDEGVVESHALLMTEAFYTIACEYELAYHLLWPLFEQASPVSEPFRAHFELWKHGADYRFAEPDLVRVYVPNLVRDQDG